VNDGTLIPFAAVLSVLCAGSAEAQTPQGAEGGAFEVSAGWTWSGGTSLGTRDATLTGGGGERFVLFSTTSKLASASGAEVRLGRRVARLVHAEVSASYAAPALHTDISGDSEGAAATTASESIQQVVIEGTAIVLLPRRRAAGRMRPFVSSGAGYVRRLHAGRTLVQTGRTYHVGGGVKAPFLSRDAGESWLTQMGVRIELRAVARTRGVALDRRAHVTPAVTASLYVRF
jgi:hypothetical protein